MVAPLGTVSGAAYAQRTSLVPCPRDHAGQELSLQGRVQEFAFMVATGAVSFASRTG
jgi:hypothetical protein